MKLPTELRLRIYQFHFEGLKLRATDRLGDKIRIPGILGACRQVRTEAMDILYEISTLHMVVYETGFDILAKHVHVVNENSVPAIGKPIRDAQACCTLLGKFEVVFRKVKKVELEIHCDDDGLLPLEWGILTDRTGYDSSITDKELARRAFDEGNKPYNIWQTAHTLANCLRFLGRVQDINIKIYACHDPPDEEIWILKAFTDLRNVKSVRFSDLESYGLRRMVKDYTASMASDPDIARMVTLMKANLEVTTNADAERLEDDYVELAEIIDEFDMDEQGSWADEAREQLFKARAASFDVDPAEFEKRRYKLLKVWNEELERRQKELKRVGGRLDALRTRLEAQAEESIPTT